MEFHSIRDETRQDVSELKTLVVHQHKMSACSQSGADLFADSRDGSVRRDSLRGTSVRTTKEEQEQGTRTTKEEVAEGDYEGSRLMPSVPEHLRPERGQGRFNEESRKLSPPHSGLRHNPPQILGDEKGGEDDEEEEEEEEEEEDLAEERQHIEHNVEARVVVQLDRSLGWNWMTCDI